MKNRKDIVQNIKLRDCRHIATLLLIFTVLFPVAAQNIKQQKPILIQDQGSFAVGGTISNPGTFDP